jgi:CarD family transcriptional regulator
MAQKTKVPVTAKSTRGSAKPTEAKRATGREPEKKAAAAKSSSVKARAGKQEKQAKTKSTSGKQLIKKQVANNQPAASKKIAPASKQPAGQAAKVSAKTSATVEKTRPAEKPVEKSALPPAAMRVGQPAPTQQRRAMTAAMAKAAQPKISAPVTPKDVAARTKEARQEAQAAKKSVSARHGFKTNEYIVYPTHGVGRIVGIEEQEIAGMSLELFVITFEKDKMTLRVPTGKLQSVGMRKLASEDVVKKAMDTLKGRARIKRTMWSRRAQEYEAKINSGDLVAIAEVVRDLYRSESQPEQSYSERQLYEAALDRMAREIAAVEKLDEQAAVQRITEVLAKSARGRRAAEEAEAEGDDDGEADPAVRAA